MPTTLTDAYGHEITLWGVDVSPERRMVVARECLRQCWQIFDYGGESMGRSRRCAFLEAAIALLGDADPEESRRADRGWAAYYEQVVHPLVSDVRTIERVADEKLRMEAERTGN